MKSGQGLLLPLPKQHDFKQKPRRNAGGHLVN